MNDPSIHGSPTHDHDPPDPPSPGLSVDVVQNLGAVSGEGVLDGFATLPPQLIVQSLVPLEKTMNPPAASLETTRTTTTTSESPSASGPIRQGAQSQSSDAPSLTDDVDVGALRPRLHQASIDHVVAGLPDGTRNPHTFGTLGELAQGDKDVDDARHMESDDDLYMQSNSRLTSAAAPDVVSSDLVDSVPGMYRILERVSEAGSGGLVDKILISQESLGRLVNDLRPGAYTSMTKVDFAALDSVHLKPLGVYGSQSELVRFLQSINAVSDEVALLLRTSVDEPQPPSKPHLRSGLYLLRQAPTGLDEKVYVIYWPQETTWNDNADSAVRKNRVTFMRYLTKIAHQNIALVSSEHASEIVWNEDQGEDELDVGEAEDSDRLFTFEVSKTKEQEEGIQSSPGFIFAERTITSTAGPVETEVNSRVEHAGPGPRLITGESACGFIVPRFMPSSQESRPISEEHTGYRLRSFVLDTSLRLSPGLSAASLNILLNHGLDMRAPEQSRVLKEREMAARQAAKAEQESREVVMKSSIRESDAISLKALVRGLKDIVATRFVTLRGQLGGDQEHDMSYLEDRDHLHSLVAMFSDIQRELLLASEHKALSSISTSVRSFKTLKRRFLRLEIVLREHRPNFADERMRRQFVDTALNSEDLTTLEPEPPTSTSQSSTLAKWIPAPVFSLFGGGSAASKDDTFARSLDKVNAMSDEDFLHHLSSIVDLEPLAAEAAADLGRQALEYLQSAIQKKAETLLPRVRRIQEDELKKAIRQEVDATAEKELSTARGDFLASVEGVFLARDSSYVALINNVAETPRKWSSGSTTYTVSGTSERRTTPVIRYQINVLKLTEDDKQQIQLDPSFIPSPRLHSGSNASFQLPVQATIMHAQLLQNGDCLLIYDDGQSTVSIYLEPIQSLGAAIQRGAYKKELKQDKLGGTSLYAFDETRRLLAVYGKLQVHLFVFDERYTMLRGWGSNLNLASWYDQSTSISHMTFVGGGAEELVFVDQHCRVRVYSVVTQQIRPAFVMLPETPLHVLASPDASCLFTVAKIEGKTILRTYHWSNFGSSPGISVNLDDIPVESCGITSIVHRTNVHFVTLDLALHQLRSCALAITRKITEFSFKEKGAAKISAGSAKSSTAHNCLLDCHSEVWIRFPVVPAVRRRTITISSGLRPRALYFATDRDHDEYVPYWKDAMAQFERTTRKPTEKELSGILVQAMPFPDAFEAISRDISTFLAGEWLVDILCLIPIHIAVTRDNRFVPLKDGVTSAELERSLLGAKVEQIVDRLSFGWYESVFQSYMANKPVKVVSSMGEQSVGKSFALNHLVDTSFAGSAMRTTEGVWMSVNPTDEALIVALDFEGVHSIERSAQEDTLLVLFNTAISNLVLFRNNFALSRDITGLFQSFQSSSTVLDPAANPDLFRSTLVIIIKDVVDSDKREITKEFSLKFQQIVQQEQEANFISRLHRGRINIIPWPVIESKQFYSLFPTLKKCLDKEPATHARAGVFLQTLKTLMAKLKANDWGAMSQNLAAHRAQILASILPTAMMYGAMEVDPERDPLKDFDSNTPLPSEDTDAVFFLAESNPKEHPVDAKLMLSRLELAWPSFANRSDSAEEEWIAGLSEHLESLVQRRVDAVQSWVDLNTARFSDATASIEPLKREVHKIAGDLKASVQLCKMKCADCHLSCLQVRYHDGGHDCATDHQCPRSCQYSDMHAAELACGLPSGHPGIHICDVSEHLCGRECHLAGKDGCMGNCVKVVNHDLGTDDEEHVCQAKVHGCGAPCSLADISLRSGNHASCPDKCRLPSHEPHEQHHCGAGSCPLPCLLCKRLCSDRDHMHALDKNAVHLCGQDHPCGALCGAEGICHIETTPQSVEATFTGRHEQFQYTKYSQIHKRLQCVVTIPAGLVHHPGAHTHKVTKAFHFCKSTCESCGYYCTLPFGHPQQEHETSHGSMTKTKWAVDGPDGQIVELNGRKFSANDDGAPMLCSLMCRSMGRHAHIDFCRSANAAACSGTGLQHETQRLHPAPERAKDWISHKLYWQRSGFKDPYSHDDQSAFEKCDSMCPGLEHQPDPQGQSQPSHCALPLFHPPHQADQVPPGGGYVSGDGHLFNCRNPAVLQNSFHVIFVIDRSGSMGSDDRRPLQGTPVTARISSRCNNRLGAVYSALHAFWTARATVAAQGAAQQAQLRRDAYSVILFDNYVQVPIANDFQSTPDQLLNTVLAQEARGGTDYDRALQEAQRLMENHWSTDRSPVVIFLSDGECGVNDARIQDVCRRAVARGGSLSFHAVAFGPSNQILRRMVQLATEIQSRAPVDPMKPAVASSYSEALDSIRLAETFLGIADSLRKPRGSLMRS